MKLKCFPNVDNIHEIEKILNYFLDKEFLENQSQIIKKERGDDQLAKILPVMIHPGFDFLNFVKVMIKTNPSSLHPLKVYRARDLMHFSLAAKTIMKICDGKLENFPSNKIYSDFRGRFRAIDGYHHLIYEMYFARFLEFHAKDVKLEIFNETGKKWPDIKAVKENKTMRIECKSLESTQTIRNKICYEVLKVLYKNKKKVSVEIKLKKQPTNESMIIPLIKSLKKQILKNNFTSEDGTIEISSLDSKYLVKDFDQLLWPDNEDFSVHTVEGNATKSTDFIYNPKIIRLYFEESYVPKSAIDSNFKNVREKFKNIPTSDLGIFALDVTDHIRMGPGIRDTKFKTLISKIEKIVLNKFGASENSLISGVVLTYTIPKSSADGGSIDFTGKLIRNPNAINKIPVKFIDFSELGNKFSGNIITPRSLLLESQDFEKLKNFDDALRKLDECIDLHSQKECYFHKGRLLCKLGRFSEAKSPLEKFLEFEEHPQVLRWLSRCHCETGELKKCVDTYEKLFAHEDNVAADWFNKSLAHFKLNDKPSALHCVDKSLDLDPTYELAKKLKLQIESI